VRIALLAPLVAPIGSPFLGGAQALLHDLALGLARSAHDVTLFAATGSRFEDQVDAGLPGTVRLVEVPVEPGELSPAEFHAVGSGQAGREHASRRQGELFLDILLEINRAQPAFEIAHAHAFDWPVFALGPLSGVPVVHTVHLPSVDRHINAIIRSAYRKTGRSRVVTVSRACAATYASEFPIERVIYNGIETGRIPFGGGEGGFLLFAGRISPEKGADLAIEIARRAGRKLVLAGGVYDRAFFEEKIVPRLKEDPDLSYAGMLERSELYRLMGRAEGLLFTSRWEEPFGLVIVESLAAGTPVIAWRRGAAPEIIDEGKTGFLLPLGDVEGAAQRVRRLPELDRLVARREVEARFPFERMIREYVDYYRWVVKDIPAQPASQIDGAP
jgi:UDP-glucose:tetrahydrobiopterin glucosyltransferase